MPDPGVNAVPRRATGLYAAWALAALLGAACAGVFVAGLLRDTHFGEASVPLDLGAVSGERSAEFRVWRDGPYDLFLTTLHHGRVPWDSPAFSGALGVRVIRPDGGIERELALDGEELDHRLPAGGMTWTRIDELRLPGGPLGRWRLEGRVAAPDPRFAGSDLLRSRLLLRPRRSDPGMGGLLNYAMIVPATLLLLLSLALALAVAHRTGRRGTVWVSALLLLALLALVGL